MANSNFMVKFRRKDGMSLTSVYEEGWNDIGIFEKTVGLQKDIFSFLDEEMVNKINTIMDESYYKVGVDYIPTSWFTIDGNEEEAKLFTYTFFQRMGRNPHQGELYTGVYTSSISFWDMLQI